MATATTDLKSLIDRIEDKIADHEAKLGPKPEGFGRDWADWRDRHEAGFRKMRAELEREVGARFTSNGCDHVLTLGGVRSSCTSGIYGLLRNWIGLAKRRLES